MDHHSPGRSQRTELRGCKLICDVSIKLNARRMGGRGVIWVYLSNDIRVAFWRGKTSAALFPFSELHNSWLLLIIGFYDCAVSGTMRSISSGRPTGGASANAAFMRIARPLPVLIPALIEQLHTCSWFMRAYSSS